MDELDEKCITASVLDNSNNLDNMEFDKKTDDDKFYDKIQLKQSDYSGDEWRTSCQFQLFLKGICVFDAINHTIEDALVQIMNILRNPSSYKIKNTKLDDSLKITDLSSDKCITASVLDNSDNLDNMEFDKKTDDDKFYDKIQLKIVPRY
ncbi:hypothetical protein LCGC14_1894780, partial [marine sediment metagenome]